LGGSRMQEQSIHMFLEKFHRLWSCDPCVVRLLGSLTVDIITTSSLAEAEIGDPEIGGSGFRTWKAWQEFCQPAELDHMDVAMLGKIGAPDPQKVWNQLLDILLEREGSLQQELRRNLVLVKDWEVPRTVIVLYPDGTQDRFQQSNSAPWDHTDLARLGREQPGLLYLGGGWREPVYDEAATAVEQLKKKGWLLALHSGSLSLDDEAKLDFIRHVLQYLDILFTTPNALLMLGAPDAARLEPFRRHAASALEFIASGQLRLHHQPPVIIVHEGLLKLEMLLREPHGYFRVPPAIPLADPVSVPPGLRSGFVAAFLLQLGRHSRAGVDSDPVSVLKDCLAEARAMTLALYSRRLQVASGAGAVLSVGRLSASSAPTAWHHPWDAGKLLSMLVQSSQEEEKAALSMQDIPLPVKELLWELERKSDREFAFRELIARGMTQHYIKNLLKKYGILQSTKSGGRHSKLVLTEKAKALLQGPSEA